MNFRMKLDDASQHISNLIYKIEIESERKKRENKCSNEDSRCKLIAKREECHLI